MPVFKGGCTSRYGRVWSAREPTGTSVAPPGWTAAVASASELTVAAAPVDRAEAAVRWRISAACIDNIAVHGGYLAPCAVLHWKVGSYGIRAH